MPITEFNLEVKPKIPEAIEGLKELSENLLYSWHGSIRELFITLDPALWVICQHNPKLFLRRVDEELLISASKDPEYLQRYQDILHWSRDYCASDPEDTSPGCSLPDQTLIAYFCAEFGFHESFPIYSGGLGILAGDHCKAASDMGIPFVAVGLLYHEGYFTQTIDAQGHQICHYSSQSFVDSPISELRDDAGNEISISVPIGNDEVVVKLWKVSVGRIQLILLDSDVSCNSLDNRSITRQLYGGDHSMRLQQELILGVGGVRALAVLGIKPTVWHINEGHAAFSIFQRILELMTQQTLGFDAALEQIAAATVFTIHTPIAAGHDRFDRQLIEHFAGRYIGDLGLDIDQFMALGEAADDQFNMTALALRGSRFHNAVSRIHGGVAARMEQYLWPQIPADENPITYITNGIHVESFLHKRWRRLFDSHFSDCRHHLDQSGDWNYVDHIDDETWWTTHCEIKKSLLLEIEHRLRTQHQRNGLSEALIERCSHYVAETHSDILLIGFARRFATYKRAGLLFLEVERLAALVSNPDRPVVFVFAGKAHPSDDAGKQLIKLLYERSLQPEFIGRIILLEGYDIAQARMLVAGCDIWLNTPEYPLEACGTSGQKAAVNGVVNLSIRDGWWDEGYNGKNGWALSPHDPDCDPGYRDRQEAIDFLNILESQVIPAWWERENNVYPARWVAMSKASMSSTMAKFSAQRMVRDYVETPYLSAAQQGARIEKPGVATALADWKRRVAALWPGVKAQRIDSRTSEVEIRESITLSLRVNLNGLDSSDIVVECILGKFFQGQFVSESCIKLGFQIPEHDDDHEEGGDDLFSVDWKPSECGLKQYRLRVYPYHELLSHPLETGCMLWV